MIEHDPNRQTTGAVNAQDAEIIEVISSNLEVLRRAAYHEAGHAVAAVRAGGRLVHVHIAGYRNLDLPTAGNVRWHPRPGNEEVHLLDRLSVMYAGPMAEARLFGRRPDHERGDHDDADRFIREHRLTRDQVKEAKRWAAEVVDEDWRAIETLAVRLVESELDEQDELDGAEATRVIVAALS